METETGPSVQHHDGARPDDELQRLHTDLLRALQYGGPDTMAAVHAGLSLSTELCKLGRFAEALGPITDGVRACQRIVTAASAAVVRALGGSGEAGKTILIDSDDEFSVPDNLNNLNKEARELKPLVEAQCEQCIKGAVGALGRMVAEGTDGKLARQFGITALELLAAALQVRGDEDPLTWVLTSVAALGHLTDGKGATAERMLRGLLATVQSLGQGNDDLCGLANVALALSLKQQSRRDLATELLQKLSQCANRHQRILALQALATHKADVLEHDEAVRLRRLVCDEAASAPSIRLERLTARVRLAAAHASGAYFVEAVSELREVDEELSALHPRTMASSDQYPAIRKEVHRLLFRVACSRGDCDEARSCLGTMLAGVSGHDATGHFGLPSNGTLLKIDTMSELASANYVAGHFETALSQSREVYSQAKTWLGPSDVKTLDAATTVALSQMAAGEIAEAKLLLTAALTEYRKGSGEHTAGLPPAVVAARHVLEQLEIQLAYPQNKTEAGCWVAGAQSLARTRHEAKLRFYLRLRAHELLVHNLASQLVTHAAGTVAQSPPGSVRRFTPQATTAPRGGSAGGAPTAAEARASTQAGLPVGARAGIGASKAPAAPRRRATAAIAEVPFRGETDQAALDHVARERARASRCNARMEQSTSDKAMHIQVHAVFYRDDKNRVCAKIEAGVVSSNSDGPVAPAAVAKALTDSFDKLMADRPDFGESLDWLMSKSAGKVGATPAASKANVTLWLRNLWRQWVNCLVETCEWTGAMGHGWIPEGHTPGRGGVIETILRKKAAGLEDETLPLFVTIVQPPQGNRAVCFRERACNDLAFATVRTTHGCVISFLFDLGRNESEAEA